jgi:hypothetical protein
MATEMRKRVADLLHTHHSVSRTKLRGLSVKDSAELRAVAMGTQAPEYRIKALSVLGESRDSVAADVFRVALADGAADPEVRAAGATWLSRLGGMAAEGALLDRLAVEELPIVLHKIVAGLARVGSEASLRRLSDIARGMDPAVREHAHFAQAVIAARAGASGFESPAIDESLRLPAGAATGTFTSSPIEPEEAVRILEQTAGDNFGVEGHPESVVSVKCGRRNLAVVVDMFLRHGMRERLSRPAIAGYVAVRAETDGSYATGLLVLARPSGSKRLYVSVNRLSGRIMYFGEGDLDDDAFHFRLDAVRAPGATATTMTGTLTGQGLADLRGTSGQTLERARPTPMEDR